MRLRQVFLRGVVADPHPCVRIRGRLDELHLSQATIDGSCGLIAVLQAAMLLAGISRAQILALTTTRQLMLRRFWKSASASYFHGATAMQLVGHVGAFEPKLRGRAIRLRRLAHAGMLVQTLLDAGTVPIAGFSGVGFSHWSLVIGLERDARGAFTAILLLDPSVPPPTLALFNARLDLGERRARYAKFGEEPCLVRLVEFVVVRRAA